MFLPKNDDFKCLCFFLYVGRIFLNGIFFLGVYSMSVVLATNSKSASRFISFLNVCILLAEPKNPQ